MTPRSRESCQNLHCAQEMTDTGSKRAGETSTVKIEGCEHFIGKTHGKEGVQIPSQSKQKDLERLVEVISPLDVAIDYASFLLQVRI